MTVSAGLVRASRIMAWLSMAAVGIAPLTTFLLFVWPEPFRMVVGEFSITAHYAALLTADVPLMYRLAAMLFALVPTAIAMWGLWSLSNLFRLFGDGEVFSPRALRLLGSITSALFLNVLAAFLAEVPITYFLTLARAHQSVSLTLGSDDVQLLFLAGIALVIARVMGEARKVADENASFV